MKTMVIGHSYCSPINHQKLAALAALCPGRIHVITPRDWRDMLMTVSTAEMPAPSAYDHSKLSVLFNGRESIFLYDPVALARLLRREQPGLIHISQDPRMLSCWECVALIRRVLGRRCKIVVVAQENDPDARVRLPNRLGRDYVLRSIDHLIAGNPGALELVRSLGYAGPATVLSHFGVDTGQFSPSATPATPPAIRIGYIGRFVWYKGIETLVKAAVLVREPHRLVLVGRGPHRRPLQRLVRQLRLGQRVTFLDSVSAEQVPALLRELDILVLPSLCKEQFGRVLVEAMACGVPVVGSDSGAIPWVIGEAGLIFPANDHHQLADRLGMLCRDPGLRQRLGRLGQQRVRDNFSYPVVGQRTMDVWLDAAAGSAPAGGPVAARAGSARPTVLIIGHSYCAPINHQKVAALGDRFDGELHLAMPLAWRQTLHTVTAVGNVRPANYQQWYVPIFFNGHETVFCYHPRRLTTLLATLKPDLVQVEQDPRMVACFQCVYRARKLLGPKCRITVVAQENQPVSISPLNKLGREYVYRHIDHLLAGNPGALQLARSKGYRGAATVLPHLGVDAQQFNPGQRGAARRGPAQIGYVGRLEWYKGLETLIRASAELSVPHQVVIIGKGPYERQIRALALRLGIEDRVVYRRDIPHEQMPDVLAHLDMLVLPSLTTAIWKEQFGHVLIEAMACQVPVVGSDSGAIPWVIGDSGLVFREGDHRDLAAQLTQLCRDELLRSRLGVAGRQRVLAAFTHQRIAQDTTAIWAGLQKG